MNKNINEEVAVVSSYDPNDGRYLPWRIRWGSREYNTRSIAAVIPHWEDSHLHHQFTIFDGTQYLLLDLDTSNLHWRLVSIGDNSII